MRTSTTLTKCGREHKQRFSRKKPSNFMPPNCGNLNFVRTNGPFERFTTRLFLSWALIDSRGRVVFNASLDKGGGGIFNGPDPVANKVVDYAGELRNVLLQGVRADDTVLFRATKPEGGTAYLWSHQYGNQFGV